MCDMPSLPHSHLIVGLLMELPLFLILFVVIDEVLSLLLTILTFISCLL